MARHLLLAVTAALVGRVAGPVGLRPIRVWVLATLFWSRPLRLLVQPVPAAVLVKVGQLGCVVGQALVEVALVVYLAAVLRIFVVRAPVPAD